MIRHGQTISTLKGHKWTRLVCLIHQEQTESPAKWRVSWKLNIASYLILNSIRHAVLVFLSVQFKPKEVFVSFRRADRLILFIVNRDVQQSASCSNILIQQKNPYAKLNRNTAIPSMSRTSHHELIMDTLDAARLFCHIQSTPLKWRVHSRLRFQTRITQRLSLPLKVALRFKCKGQRRILEVT